MRRGGQGLGTAAVALAAIGWGTWALFLRGSGIEPAWTAAAILCVVGAASLPAALRAPAVQRPRWAWLLIGAAALADGGNYATYFAALDRGPIAIAVLTHYLAPVVVAVFAPVAIREPLGPRTPWALAAAVTGLAVLVLGDGGLPHTAWAAAALGGASALFYGANTLVTKRAFEWFSAAQILSFHCWLAAPLVLLTARGPAPSLAAFWWRPLAGAVLVGAVGSGLFYVGLRWIAAQRAAVLTYLEPLVAAGVGAAFFGERLGPAALLGAALILAGGVAAILSPVTQRAPSSGTAPAAGSPAPAAPGTPGDLPRG